MKRFTAMIIILCTYFSVHSQILKPVKWSYASKRLTNNTAVFYLKAEIEHGWHIYSLHQNDGGPVETSFIFLLESDNKLLGKTIEPKPYKKYEKSFDMDVSYFENSVIFQQKIRLNSNQTNVKGSLNFMACNNQKCLPPEDVEFNIPVK